MNTKKPEEKYVVRIFRKDGVTFDVLVDSNFKECKKKWEEMVASWQKCHKEAEVFVINTPIISAFEPGSIYEIMLIPFNDQIQTVDDGNPYKQQMLNKGLASTLKNVGNYPEILDEGAY